MRKKKNVFDRMRALSKPEYAGLSAEELRARDPAAALRLADFIRDNKAELVSAMTAKLEGKDA